VCGVTNGVRLGYEPMSATIEPEPSEAEREAILAALARPFEQDGGWAEQALLEGVEDVELDP
jgi:hypothetical protein